MAYNFWRTIKGDVNEKEYGHLPALQGAPA